MHDIINDTASHEVDESFRARTGGMTGVVEDGAREHGRWPRTLSRMLQRLRSMLRTLARTDAASDLPAMASMSSTLSWYREKRSDSSLNPL